MRPGHLPSARRKRNLRRVGTASLILVPAGVAATLLVSHAQGTFDLSWWTADGGGGEMSGGSYSVAGTFGQADAGAALSGGQFSVTGGFWPGVEIGEAPSTPTGTALPPTDTPTPTGAAPTPPDGSATATATGAASPTRTATPTPADTGTAEPVPERHVSGRARIDGRTDHSGAEVRIQPGGHTATTDAQGRYVVGPLTPGAYRIDIRHPGHLRSGERDITVVAGQSVRMPDALLLGGDIDGDDAVDIRDGAICGRSFGFASGDTGFDPRADLTGDGAIDISDLAILGNNFGCRSDDTTDRCRRWDR